jgi:hypothetical protein
LAKAQKKGTSSDNESRFDKIEDDEEEEEEKPKKRVSGLKKKDQNG